MSRYKNEILQIVLSSDEHLTAEDIFLRLKSYMPKVVLATVYNNLNALCSEEKIKKVSIEGSPDRYDKILKHEHLICKKCKKITDVFVGDLTKEITKKLNIKDLSYELNIFYLCDECKE